MAIANFAFPHAPHELLKPGRVFEFGAGNTLVARVLLGELAGFIEADD
jgi:hypothetical protein